MGYDFHITRRAAWSEDAGDPILVDEWLALAGSVDHLEPISETTVGTQTLKLPPDGHSHRWRAHPQYRPNGPIFQFCAGNVDFRGDDPATMAFALRLATGLGAKVVGDGGEEYTLREVIGPAADLSSNPVNPFTREPFYSEREGLVERCAGECHLLSRRQPPFDLLGTHQRLLLHFVAAPPAPLEELDGWRIRVRGSLSAPGEYGAERACDNVFYVLVVVAFAPASQ